MLSRSRIIIETSKKHPRVLLFLSLLAIAFAVYRAAIFVETNKYNQLKKTGEARVGLYAKSLQDSIEKYRPIPYLLARDTRVRALLQNELPPIKVNPHLEDFALTGGTLIFVLDRDGTTVASSNWRSPQSLIGNNFSFRPYFTDAEQGRPGGYYAVGIKTKEPGFFISYPVLKEGIFLGVVVVKVNLEQLQQAWQESGETVIVSDAFGVLFLSSKPEWKYRSLRLLSEKTQLSLQTRQYLNQPLTPLRVEQQTAQKGKTLTIEGNDFIEQSQQLLEYGWRIHYLSKLAPVIYSFHLALLIGAGVVISILLTSLYLKERRERLRSKQEAREAKAVKQLNELLKIEIAQHKATEKNLKIAQKELLQAGKLAALGRMSAAIAHELNQPVTAMRTFLASCRIFVERNQIEKVTGNLSLINDLTERMMAITGQLKTFARKSSSPRESVDLTAVVEKVLSFLTPQLALQGITVQKHFQTGEEQPVLGDALQLEQVISNLIQNGVDSMGNQDQIENPVEKKLQLTLKQSDNQVQLAIQDNGPGIADEALESLFEPFFTTKEIGQGLGLGLSISYGIIIELGGTITAENVVEGGAMFTLSLPLVSSNTPQRGISATEVALSP